MQPRKITIDAITLNYDASQFLDVCGEVFRLLAVRKSNSWPQLVYTVDTTVGADHESTVEILCCESGDDLPGTRYHYLGSTDSTRHWFGRHHYRA